MKNVLAKLNESGNPNVLLCERGASFGYNTLVSDMRSLPIMASLGAPVVFDATTRCSSRAGRAVPPAVSGNLSKRCLAQLSPLVSQASSSRPMRTRTTRLLTARTWFT